MTGDDERFQSRWNCPDRREVFRTINDKLRIDLHAHKPGHRHPVNFRSLEGGIDQAPGCISGGHRIASGRRLARYCDGAGGAKRGSWLAVLLNQKKGAAADRPRRGSLNVMTTRISRRRALKVGAAAAALPLVHIRTAGAAGKLSLGLWDHWVPSGSPAMKKLIDAWAAKNKVEVEVDFLTSMGSKINITMAAEAQAKTGHDVYAFDQWTVQQYADSLDPVDDLMGRLIAKYGKLGHAYEYLAVVDKALDGGAGRLGLRATAALRAHQPDQEVQQHRRARVVPRASCNTGRQQGLDLRHAAQDGRGDVQERLSRSASAAARTARTPTRPGVPRSAPSVPTWWMPRATSRSSWTT